MLLKQAYIDTGSKVGLRDQAFWYLAQKETSDLNTCYMFEMDLPC